MELHEVRYVLTVNQTLNFTRAAEICHVSQPALSRAVRKIEEELGGALFERNKRRVQMTDLGRAVEATLQEIITQEAAAKCIAAEFSAARQRSAQLWTTLRLP
jgi:DNA-binding transcriptional LysR family regulator